MTNKWEVLLARDNGYNRTVIIEDCMYESEAQSVAENMYGQEVLRVLYKGPMNNQQPRDYNDFERHAERTRYTGPTAFEAAFGSPAGSGLGLLALLELPTFLSRATKLFIIFSCCKRIWVCVSFI